MSKHQRNAAGALGAIVALGAAVGVAPAGGDAGELPDASAGPENAAGEFVASEVVAERDALRAENERLAGELADARADLERERRLSAPSYFNVAHPLPRTRPIFDASYACAVDGKRVTFAPGDPVPDHIDPAELPAGAWRLAPEEG